MAGNSPIRIQVGVKIRAPKGVQFGRSFLDEVIKAWFSGEMLPSGVKIIFIKWNHGGRRATVAKTPVGIAIAKRQFRGLLQYGRLEFTSIRKN